MMKPPIDAVHPELRALASKLPQLNFSRKQLKILRFLEQLAWLGKKPADVSIVNLFIAGTEPKQQIRLRIYRPKFSAAPAAKLPVMLWLHGGGYMIGQPEQDDTTCAQYVNEVGMVVVSVEYRRAPENPFPKALDDSYAALQWVHNHADLLGIDPNRIAVGGASAGGGLAAAVVQYAMAWKEVVPVFQLLVYPMLDDRTVLRTDLDNQVFYGWTPRNNRMGWEAYLETPPGGDYAPKYAAPARCEDLSGLPPAWIGVGTLDLFHDEDMAYGRKLQASGVPCVIYEVPGGFHGFDLAGIKYPVVRDFRQSQIAALKKYLLTDRMRKISEERF